MRARVIEGNGVELLTENFGEPSDPAVLLIMGAMASAVWWPARFCQGLAARGHYVIRYDHRDTGGSTSYAPGSIEYSVEDLADDAVAVLDFQVGAWRLLSGSAHAFDEAYIRALAEADYDRTPNPLTPMNHALVSGGERWYGRLAEIAARASSFTARKTQYCPTPMVSHWPTSSPEPCC